MINRIKIRHFLNLFWHLWKLANENLSYTILSHDTTILRVTHSTSADWFTSWSFLCWFKIQNQCLTKNLASLLCQPFQYSLIELRIRRRETCHRLPFRWQFNVAVKKVGLIFTPATDHGLTDAISELFSTTSASATILSLNARLYDARRALSMMTTWLEINDFEHGIVW